MLITAIRKEHQNRDPTHTVLWGFLSVSSCPHGQAESEDLVCYWCSSVTLWLEGAFEYSTLDAVRTAEFSQALAPRPVKKTTPEKRLLHPHAVEPGNLAATIDVPFHLDRVNRLPERTQRRVYSCAAPAQRRGDGAKFFHWGVSLSKKFEHCYYVSNVHIWDIQINKYHSFGIPPPFYEYYIHRIASTYICMQSTSWV